MSNKEAINEFYSKALTVNTETRPTENFKTAKWETEDAFANGDTASFFGQMVGLLTKSNQDTKEFPWALRVKVKDGKIILWNWFEDSFEVSQTYHKQKK